MPPRSHVYDKGVEPVPGYRLTDYLGGGTFGEVWKTIDLSTSKHFALKIIDLSYSSSALKELRALKLVMNLNHPNLVPITKAWLKDKHGQSLDLHTVDLVRQKGKLKLLLILMGLGERSLSARLKEVNRVAGGDADDDEPITRGIPPAELTNYMLGAAKGIDYLNAARHEGVDPASDGPIVHCDIKPDNMMIVAGTEVQIADCGVAVSLNQDTRKTVSVAFSAVYAPPELSANRPSTGTDQYSLAISYYELRTGRRPFPDGMNPLEMMTAHSLGDLDLASLTLTEGERKVLKWATSPRIAERYPTCLDMVKQIERAIEGLTPRPPGDLPQKSAPLLLVPAPPSGPAAYPAPRAPAPGDTQEHRVDLFTPPPIAGASGGSDPFVLVRAAKAPGSESDMAAVEGDVIGRKFAFAELDSELQEIIRGSQAVAHPATRTPYVEPAPRPTQPTPPPAVVDLAETVIRLDTDPKPVEPEPKRGRRGRREVSVYDNTIVPGGGLRLQPSAKLGDPPASDSAPWNGRPAGGKKSPALLVGVTVAVLTAIGGGAVAIKLMTTGDSVVTAPTEPTRDPETPTTDRDTRPTERDAGTKPTGIGQPPPTARQVFDTQLAALSPPYGNNAGLAKLFEASGDDDSFRRALLTKLFADSSRLAELADFATSPDRWAAFDEPRRVDLANAWYEDRLRRPYDKAVAGLEATPNPAPGELAGFRDALALPTAAKLDAVIPDKMREVRKFAALVTAWENARAKLPEFAAALSTTEAPPAGKFFAAEYVKLALAQGVKLEDFKSVRDKTKAWGGIDGSYQTALADYVQAELMAESPKWTDIVKKCDRDAANGWKDLAAADETLRTSPEGTAKLPRLPDMADDAGKQFARYLTNCASKDVDGLVNLYKDAKPTTLLGVKPRKKFAAEVIYKGTALVRARRNWSADPVKYLFTNPYSGLPDNDAQAARLETAARLDGVTKTAEQMHRYLISVALKAPDKTLTVGLKVGEGVVKDEHRAAALAYSMLVFKDEARDNATRVKAAAAAARLAFHRLEDSFAADCKTDKETADRQKAIATRIQLEITKPCLALVGNDAGADAKSVRFSDVRADILLGTLQKPARLDRLLECVKDVAGTTDESAALALLALSRYSDTYREVVGEQAMAKAWEAIRGNAKRSLELDPQNFYASLVINYLDSSEYKGESIIVGVKPPASAVLANARDLDRAVKQFETTASNLKTRKQSSFHSMRSRFLTARADDLEKAGNNDKAVEELRAQIRESNILENEQKAP